MTIERRYSTILIAISIIVFVTGLLFFLWQSKLFLFKDEIDGAKFGQFGDYIGGTLGTIFAGVNFILLIGTYCIQRDDSKINHQNQDLNYINNLYDNTVSDIKNLTFKEFKGIDVFYNLKIDNYQTPNSVMNHLNSILFSFEQLISTAQNAQYSKDEIKDITLTRIYFLYYSKVLWPIDEHIWKNLKDKLLQEHDDSKFIFPRFKKLSKETIEHLATKKVIEPNKPHITEILN
jgi:hypothetical protein